MATREDWIGRTGQEWSRHETALERLLGPAGHAGIGALAPRPGERILDLGCGSGASTLALAEAVAPGGRVTAVDISPDLIAKARIRLADAALVDVVEADAQHHYFGAGTHDVLFSRFGAMFFDNPAAAFANLHNALQPGARAVFVAWREPVRNQWASVPMTFTTEAVAPPAPSTGTGPFAWADPNVFRPLLIEAGFHDIRETPHEFMAEIADGESPDPVHRAVAFMMRIGPFAARLRGADPAAKAEAETFLIQRLGRHLHDGAVRLLASAWIIEARA